MTVFFLNFYKFMDFFFVCLVWFGFFFFFKDMSSPENALQPCRFPLSVLLVWKQTTPAFTRVLFDFEEASLYVWCREQAPGSQKFHAKCVTWIEPLWICITIKSLLLIFFAVVVWLFVLAVLKESLTLLSIPLCMPVLMHLWNKDLFLFTTITKTGKSVFRQIGEGKK